MIAYFSRTGCYVGGNIGGVWASRDWNDQVPAAGSNISRAFTAVARLVTLTHQVQLQLLTSVTCSVCYARDRALGYAKAGGPWEQSNYSLLVGGITTATASEMRGG